MGDEHVSLVCSRMDTVDHDVLLAQVSIALDLSAVHSPTHLSLLVNVTLGEAVAHHLSVQVVQYPLDLSNTSLSSWVDLVQSVVGDEVQKLGVQIIEALVGTQSCPGKRDERTSRQCIFRRSLVVRGLVVVRNVVKDSMRDGTLVGSNDTWSGGALAEKRG